MIFKMSFLLLYLFCAVTCVLSQYEEGECEDENAVFLDCPLVCNATCLNPNPICPTDCKHPRCQCDRRFVQITNGGRCVLRETCSMMTRLEKEELKPECLGENEEFSSCGRICEPNCDYPTGFFPYPCFNYCQVGCFCKPGYLRENDVEGAPCVRVERCPNFPYNLPGQRGLNG